MICQGNKNSRDLKAVNYAGQGKLTWLIDMEGYSMRNAPSLRVSTSCSNKLHAWHHYVLDMMSRIISSLQTVNYTASSVS